MKHVGTYWGAILAAGLIYVSKPSSFAEPLDIWHKRTVPFLSEIPRFLQAAYGNGGFVVLGDYSSLLTSADGNNWFWHLSPMDFVSSDARLTFLNNNFVTIPNPLGTSIDGVTWTMYPDSPSRPRFFAVGNGVFAGISDERSLVVSSNGIDWATTLMPESVSANDISFGNGMFVIVGSGTPGGYGPYGVILTSTNGLGWTFRRAQPNEHGRSVIFGNGRFLVQGLFGSSGGGPTTNLLTSSDGISWKPQILPQTVDTDIDPFPTAYGNGIFVLSGVNPTNSNLMFLASRDAENWTTHDTGGKYYPRAMTFGNNTFVVVGQDSENLGVILQSDPVSGAGDGEAATLELQSYPGLTILGVPGRTYSIEYANDLAGSGGWTGLTNVLLTTNPYLWFDRQGAGLSRRFYRVVVR